MVRQNPIAPRLVERAREHARSAREHASSRARAGGGASAPTSAATPPQGGGGAGRGSGGGGGAGGSSRATPSRAPSSLGLGGPVANPLRGRAFSRSRAPSEQDDDTGTRSDARFSL